MKEWLDAYEFSHYAGITPQAIYKRIRKKDNAINQFINHDSKPLTINKKALKELYFIDIDDIEKKEETSAEVYKHSLQVYKPIEEKEQETAQRQEKEKVNHHSKPLEEIKEASADIIKILQEQIETERESNRQKDLLITELNKRLEQSQNMLDKQQTLLSQQQQLSIADKQTILLLQEKTAVENKGKLKRIFNILFEKKEAENG